MASRLLTRSAASRLVSHLHRKTPGITPCLLTRGPALASLLGPTDGLPHAADSTLLRVPMRWLSSPSSEAVAEAPMTADGLTVDSIADKGWTILPEAESDWRSHAAAVAQSVKVIKKRLKWGWILERTKQLAVVLEKPDLWEDPVFAGRVSREQGELMGKIKSVNQFEQELIEHIEMLRLAREENDNELEMESMKALADMRRSAKEKELNALLSGDNDSCSCFIEVYFVSPLIISLCLFRQGLAALRAWTGLQCGKRRHTSFAAVAVIPILGDTTSRYQIKDSDLRIERFRSGGPGGQHANTTESAIRIVHIPTGISATSQNESDVLLLIEKCRSQHMNKASAMAVLQSRLDQLEIARQAQMNAEHTQSLNEISWGNQIRSYVLHPYRMVKDLRTNYEVSDPDSVLEGDLDDFILNYLSSSLDEADVST
ncbi:Peptide chain release factor PrfB2 chloroplastic [Zea mays]|uniref:Peptide chain release factor PrfB2 chloroplastic n=2 Tax=Zea mays TaxID=4577 RepID=A0A1D6HMT6_MAIZE|nr:Peptide chain release factor PrfB2 chloroplastic [Zea mays]